MAFINRMGAFHKPELFKEEMPERVFVEEDYQKFLLTKENEKIVFNIDKEGKKLIDERIYSIIYKDSALVSLHAHYLIDTFNSIVKIKFNEERPLNQPLVHYIALTLVCKLALSTPPKSGPVNRFLLKIFLKVIGDNPSFESITQWKYRRRLYELAILHAKNDPTLPLTLPEKGLKPEITLEEFQKQEAEAYKTRALSAQATAFIELSVLPSTPQMFYEACKNYDLLNLKRLALQKELDSDFEYDSELVYSLTGVDLELKSLKKQIKPLYEFRTAVDDYYEALDQLDEIPTDRSTQYTLESEVLGESILVTPCEKENRSDDFIVQLTNYVQNVQSAFENYPPITLIIEQCKAFKSLEVSYVNTFKLYQKELIEKGYSTNLIPYQNCWKKFQSIEKDYNDLQLKLNLIINNDPIAYRLYSEFDWARNRLCRYS